MTPELAEAAANLAEALKTRAQKRCACGAPATRLVQSVQTQEVQRLCEECWRKIVMAKP